MFLIPDGLDSLCGVWTDDKRGDWLCSRVSTGLKNFISNGRDILTLILCFLKLETHEIVTPNHESNFIRDTGDQDSYII